MTASLFTAPLRIVRPATSRSRRTNTPGLKGVWKDTIWVKNLVPPGSAPGKYTIVVRTRYERYIGDYVLHCHILDHEDQGMMQIVRVALPDGAGGTSAGHHH